MLSGADFTITSLENPRTNPPDTFKDTAAYKYINIFETL
jgi:hypothetical protein